MRKKKNKHKRGTTEVEIHARCRAEPDEPVPPVLAHFLALLSVSRLCFAISGVGFFGYLAIMSPLSLVLPEKRG